MALPRFGALAHVQWLAFCSAAGSIVWFRLLFSSPTHSSRAIYLHERRARDAGLEAYSNLVPRTKALQLVLSQ